MHTVGSIAQEFARRTRPDRAADWDPVGLQLGDPAAPVERVAVCHEINEATLGRLLTDPPDLAITYHPLLFNPVTRLVAGSSPAGRTWELIRSNIALLVTHTDFDACAGGTADALATEVGLSDISGFGPVSGAPQVGFVTFVPPDAVEAVVGAMAAAGAGRIGNYEFCSYRSDGVGSFRPSEGAEPVIGSVGEKTMTSETRVEMIAAKADEEAVIAALVSSHPYEEPAFNIYAARANHGQIGRIGAWSGTLEELATRVADRIRLPGLRVAGDMNRRLRRVAVVPGSGSSFLNSAVAGGADAIVTGDVGHHAAAGALDRDLAVVDPGHAATELPGMRSLVALARSLSLETIDLTGDGRGPWSSFGRDSLR